MRVGRQATVLARVVRCTESKRGAKQGISKIPGPVVDHLGRAATDASGEAKDGSNVLLRGCEVSKRQAGHETKPERNAGTRCTSSGEGRRWVWAGKQTRVPALLEHREVSRKKMGCEAKLKQDAMAGCMLSEVETAGQKVAAGESRVKK